MLTGNLFMGPERMVFGRGVVHDTGTYVRQLGGEKVFLVTDKLLAGLDAFKVIIDSLEKEGLKYYLYTDCDVNPTDNQIDNGCRIYKKEKAATLSSALAEAAIWIRQNQLALLLLIRVRLEIILCPTTLPTHTTPPIKMRYLPPL